MNILSTIGRLIRRNPSCRDVNRFLIDYMDGELSARTERRFRSHLEGCPACRLYFDQYSETVRLVRQDEVDIPAGLAEHTLEFLRSTSVWP